MKRFIKSVGSGLASIGEGMASIGEGMASLFKPYNEQEMSEMIGRYYKAKGDFAEDAAQIKNDWDAVGAHMTAAMEELTSGVSRASGHMDAAAKEAIARTRRNR